VEDIVRNLLENTQGLGAYLAILGILVACGLGVPVPEDISLVLGGYLAHIGAAKLPWMISVAFVGILAGDSMIYAAGRRIGENVGKDNKKRGLIGRIVTPEKRARVEGLFARHGQKIVMIARFMPGVRAVTYFTAGSAKMPYLRFICWDGLAALASAPLFVFLGYYFGGELEYLIQQIRHGQTMVLVGVGVLVVGYVLFRHYRNAARAAARKNVLAAQPLPAPSQPGESVKPHGGMELNK
jgi:membrane protein DedA with SNARE-associated domain